MMRCMLLIAVSMAACGIESAAASACGDRPVLQQDAGYSSKGLAHLNDEVQWVQERIGVSRDGLFGPDTAAAVVKFQECEGIARDGIVGPQTWRRLCNACARRPLLQLEAGYTQDGLRGAVRHVQSKVGATKDGKYGPKTKAKVEAWQEAHDLDVDGIVGSQTWGAMCCGKKVSSTSSGGSSSSSSGGGGNIGSCKAIDGGQPEADTTVVCGIQVHKCWAPSIEEACAAAQSAGVPFSGGGWRSPEQQIQLRREHCGTDEYAIYEMPSSQCSPPTATPGNSNHETGLAIDFTDCSPGTAIYNWLSANGAKYNLVNLPSESWHWSIDGR